MAIGATYPEIIVGDVPDHAAIVGAAPAARFTGDGAALPLPIAVTPTANGVEVGAFGKEPFHLIEAIGMD